MGRYANAIIYRGALSLVIPERAPRSTFGRTARWGRRKGDTMLFGDG
jgi:hypothetical protein